jgi:hypothetical protein
VHEHLMMLRNQVYGHSDSSNHSIKPEYFIDDISIEIMEGPPMRLSEGECTTVLGMVETLQISIAESLAPLRAELLALGSI